MQLYYSENNVMSQKQFDSHLQLYEGYINKVNDINQRTTDKIIEPRYLTAEYRNLQYALNGVILHELYFENIKDNSIENSCSPIKEINLNDWKQEFKTLALNTRGWVILNYVPRTKQFINISLSTHDEGLVCSGKPIIVLDMYEHAYYTDYSNDKNKYIENFINNIDWCIVQERVIKI